jgi:hypothetical protein
VICVLLIRVVYSGTVVNCIRNSVTISVRLWAPLLAGRLAAPTAARARVADISNPITIRILLLAVADEGALVAEITDTVIIFISLVWVGQVRTVIAGISNPITISIVLARISKRRTVVYIIPNPITISIIIVVVEDRSRIAEKGKGLNKV